ncbi:MAG: aldo/keto reductase [Candidatus Aminicenantes bacterium]|nr:aldo/keto reductase [Candidatus Aminicenantes bacterium]
MVRPTVRGRRTGIGNSQNQGIPHSRTHQIQGVGYQLRFGRARGAGGFCRGPRSRRQLRGRGEHTKESIKERAQKCHERLQTEYHDCIQIHMVPTVEQIRHESFHAALDELKAEGCVRFRGLLIAAHEILTLA